MPSDLSPRAAFAPTYSVPEHFASVGEIWDAFFDGSISMNARERLLAVFRNRLLAEVPLPK